MAVWPCYSSMPSVQGGLLQGGLEPVLAMQAMSLATHLYEHDI